jgi:hypothetical protein
MLAPSSLAQWVGAIATSFAVAVALFKDEALRRYRRPKLGVRLKPEPPDCLLVPSAIVYEVNTGRVLWSGGIYWLRLWVENVGIGRSEQVQVFASELFRKGANDRFASVAEFEPMNLRWSNSRDPNNPEIFARGISRHFGKHCDLCSISDPANPTDHDGYIGQCVGTLQLEVVPGGDRNRLPPGDYVVKIRVGAANADPVTVHVQINIKGPWSPDRETMFRNHVGVQVLSTLPPGVT